MWANALENGPVALGEIIVKVDKAAQGTALVPYGRKTYTPRDLKQGEVVGTKIHSFPLDRFLENKSPLLNPSGWHHKVNEISENAAIKKKINELADEAEKLTQGVVPFNSASESSKSSSTSLHQSESSFTEHLVETKFKEVTFKRTGKKLQTVQDDAHKKAMVYSPKFYEESSYGLDIPPLCRVTKERKPSQTRVIKPNTNRRSEKVGLILSKPSSSPSRSIKTSNSVNKILSPSRNQDKERMISDQKSKHERISYLERTPINRDSFLELAREKHYHDVSVNTEKPKLYNSTLINVTSVHDMQTEISPKLYQVQELPIVSIRPNLIKQTGPIIDIVVPKPFIKTNNVAVVEFSHPDVEPDKKCRSFAFSGNSKQKENFSSLASTIKSSRELKLQKSLKDMLKKLNKKGPCADKLKNGIHLLLGLLNKIVPFHTASLRIHDDSMSLADESIDLLFTNMDIVQEVIDHELKNPIEMFCKYPEYFLKAVNLLCGNIKSIFDVNDTQRSSVNASINGYIVKGKVLTLDTSAFSEEREDKEKKKGKTTDLRLKRETTKYIPPHSSSEVIRNPSFRGSSSGIDINIENIIPKNVYIPYRKLLPGGLFKEMEDAESLSEIELRKKRLEKIHQINKHLKKDLTQTKETEIEENSKSGDNIQEVLNATFVIESGNQEEKFGKSLSKTGTEKSNVDYEEDWEQEEATANDSPSRTEEGSLQMENFVVEAQVHSSEKSVPSGEANSPENSPTSQNDYAKQSHSSSTNSSVKVESLLETKEISKEDNPNGKSSFVSVAIQTDELIKIKSDSPKIIKKDVANETSNNAFSSVHEICPVLRMTNPLTNALLEIRFPEPSESFQNSLHFQKSESKEEIKLSFKRQQGKAREDIGGSPEEEIIIKSDSNLIKDGNNAETNEMSKGISSDLENITLDFVGFLERKLTEMVNKFKLSERLSDKLLTEKIGSKRDTKMPHASLQHIGNDLLHSDFNLKASVYKSNSSLFSDKSNEELKFFKDTVSRGCTPDYGLVKFGSLVSPSLTLQLKKDMPSQTELLTPNVIQKDACVGTSESFSDGVNFSGRPSIKITEDQKCERIVQINLLSSIDGLRWPSSDLEDITKNKNQIRLLPLPEEVLKTNNFLSSDINSQDSIDTLKTAYEQNTILSDKETQPNNKNIPELTKMVEKNFKIPEVVHNSSFSDKSSKENLYFEEETAIPLSKADGTDVGDSQRTSQIMTNFSTVDISTIQYSHSSAPPQLPNEKINRLQINMKQIKIPSSGSDSSYLKNPLPLNFECEKHNVTKNDDDDEGLQSIFITVNTGADVDLNSKYDEGIQNSMGPSEEEMNNSACSAKITGITVLRELSLEDEINTKQKYTTEDDLTSRIGERSNFNFQEEKNLFQSDLNKNEALPTDINLLEKYEDGKIPSLQVPVMDYVSCETELESHEKICNETDVSVDTKSSSLSEELITIYYYNSDMSDGEVGFAYTSKSYSSGEIIPLLMKNSEDDSENIDEISEMNMPEDPLPTPNSYKTERLSSKLYTYNDECASANLPSMVLESSSSGSISPGRLQKLLDENDKLDEITLRNLLDNNLMCSGKSSPDSSTVLPQQK